MIIGNRDTTAVLHYYSCVIRNGRFQKCLRGKLFELAERFHGWKTTEILGIQTFDRDIRIDALFKEESKCLDFQSAVKGQMRNRKRPIVEDAVDSISLEEQPSKRLFAVSNNLLSRIELEQYVHWDNADDTNNSPPCDLTSNSLSNFSAELANINEAEVRSQMIESHNAMSLFGQSPEVAHIKDKCRCKKQEIDDPNNHIYMSRNIHQHFDGIETIPIKTPSFVLKYISHDATASDCPIFGDGCYVVNPIEKRAKVIVHIIFRDSTYAKTLAVWLRDNSLYINDRTYEISLYFPKHGVDKTIKYLKWKLKKSMEQWSDVDIHIDDD